MTGHALVIANREEPALRLMLLQILLDSHVISLRSLSIRLRDSHFHRLIIDVNLVRLDSCDCCKRSFAFRFLFLDLPDCNLIFTLPVVPYLEHIATLVQAVTLIIHLTNDITSISASFGRFTIFFKIVLLSRHWSFITLIQLRLSLKTIQLNERVVLSALPSLLSELS